MCDVSENQRVGIKQKKTSDSEVKRSDSEVYRALSL